MTDDSPLLYFQVYVHFLGHLENYPHAGTHVRAEKIQIYT